MDYSCYDHKAVEKKWQNIWEECRVFDVEKDFSKPKKYILEMLPYPSGRIHMGHLRNYAIGDVMARMYAAMGFNVLHPMGWDAFGLPAENAAIQNGTSPAAWTMNNIASMREQLKPMGFSYDWSREIATCLPDYYKHEQKFFLEFYKNGLVYQKEAIVNWDPVDQTVLANEQVIDGRGWRSGAVVEKKQLKQWFLKITDFADELLEDLSVLQGWPEKVRMMQENWINKSYGAELRFRIQGTDQYITVYTTRPDTLFGASFIGIAFDHHLVSQVQSSEALERFLQQCKKSGTAADLIEKSEKHGFNTGLMALHPFDNNVVLPIFIVNFVLSDYGTGAIFGCPAHDQRDHEFALKYALPIKQVVKPDADIEIDINKAPFLEDGIMINSGFLDGCSTQQAKNSAIEYLEHNKLGHRKIAYRLKDWGVSRQRYWGCPIPIIYCDDCGIVPVPNCDLPVILPEDTHFNKPGNALDHHPTWKHVLCPACGRAAVRETDTLDTFFDSSWYFLRYCSAQSDSPFIPGDISYWMPVDHYIGGIEHAVMHLLYARFFTKVLAKIGYLDFKEPFTNLMTQGMVIHESYQDQGGNWLYPEEVTKKGNEAVHKITGKKVMVGRVEKMSKSKKNIIEPEYILSQYGADAARLFVLSDSPPDRDFEWSDAGAEGCYKYLAKIYKMVHELKTADSSAAVDSSDEPKIIKAMHSAIRDVTHALQNFHFNKAIAKLREFTNSIVQHSRVSLEMKKTAIANLLKLLNPIAPHVTEELWAFLGNDNMLVLSKWPQHDAELLIGDEMVIVIQTNGKLRATINVCRDMSQLEIEGIALNVPAVSHFLAGKIIKKVIYIPKKILNIVHV